MPMTSERASLEGFSLVEILVSVVVAGLAVSLAASIFGSGTDAVDRLTMEAEHWTKESNSRRWLAESVVGVRVRNELEANFHGTGDSVRFRTRLRVNDGWSEFRTVSIWFDGGRLLAAESGGRELTLADSLVRARLDYLRRFGSDSPWLTEWISSTTPPLAIRVRLYPVDAAGDTILLYVGERG